MISMHRVHYAIIGLLILRNNKSVYLISRLYSIMSLTLCGYLCILLMLTMLVRCKF